MRRKDHWEQVYATRPAENLGWYEPHLQTSFAWIEACELDQDAAIIDVGGGASTLADDLLKGGHRSITVLDISMQAVSSAKASLETKADLVTWIVGDITSVDFPSDSYELWHDRAVFHFLTAPDQQQKYRDNLIKALKPGGHLIIGVFALEAPSTCSGLPVQRYSHGELGRVFGSELELQRHHQELHTTPSGVEQMYLYCHFRKIAKE